ncbi:HNH endonuclease [Microbacterium sp. NPDC058021]|uniref:HNH endonuclease n=1 Tax=Microbacterium sp. NPDC058021 TaxID=3346306 RepID=UPI0036DDBA5C
MPTSVITSAAYQRMRAEMKAQWQPINAACALCGQATIDWDGPRNAPESFELDHKISRKRRPDLALDPSNAQPSHCRCNRSKGAGTATPAIGETTEEW